MEKEKNILLYSPTLKKLITGQILGVERWKRLNIFIGKFKSKGKDLCIKYDEARKIVREMDLPIGGIKTFRKDLSLVNFLYHYYYADENGRENAFRRVCGKHLLEMGLACDKKVLEKVLKELSAPPRNLLEDMSLAGPKKVGVKELAAHIEKLERRLIEKDMEAERLQIKLEKSLGELEQVMFDNRKLKRECSIMKETPVEQRMQQYQEKIESYNEGIAALNRELSDIKRENGKLLSALKDKSDLALSREANIKVLRCQYEQLLPTLQKALYLLELAEQRKTESDSRQEGLKLVSGLVDEMRKVLTVSQEAIRKPKRLVEKSKRPQDRLPRKFPGFGQEGEIAQVYGEYNLKFRTALKEIVSPELRKELLFKLEEFSQKGDSSFETEKYGPAEINYPKGIFRSWLLPDWYITWAETASKAAGRRIIKVLRLEKYIRCGR